MSNEGIIVYNYYNPFKIGVWIMDRNDAIMNRIASNKIKYKEIKIYSNKSDRRVILSLIKIRKKDFNKVVKIINDFYKNLSIFEDKETTDFMLSIYKNAVKTLPIINKRYKVL